MCIKCVCGGGCMYMYFIIGKQFLIKTSQLALSIRWSLLFSRRNMAWYIFWVLNKEMTTCLREMHQSLSLPSSSEEVYSISRGNECDRHPSYFLVQLAKYYHEWNFLSSSCRSSRVLISLLEAYEFLSRHVIIRLSLGEDRGKRAKVSPNDTILGLKFPELRMRIVWGCSSEEVNLRWGQGVCDLSTREEARNNEERAGPQGRPVTSLGLR